MLLFSGGLYARNFEITQLTIVAEIHPSGEVSLSEERTFAFEGSYSWFEQDFRRRGFRVIRDFTLSEGGQAYGMDDSRDPGSFSVRESRRLVTVRTNFRATDESRTFTLRYVLEGALASDGDWAEFYWTFLGSDWERAHQNIRIEILLPEELSADELVAWHRSAAINPELRTERNRVIFTADRQREDRVLRIRTFFPARLVADAMPSETPLNPFEIKREREEAAEREARNIAFLSSLGWILSVVAVGLAIYLVKRYGQRPQLGENLPKMADRPPSDLPPALAGWLFRYTHSDQNSRFVSTLFDLARRGYFTLQQETETTGTFRKTETDVYVLARTGKTDLGGLRDWEKEVIALAEQRLAGETKRLDKLFDYEGSEGQEQTAFVERWAAWDASLEKEAIAKNWFVDNAKPLAANLIVQAVLFLFGVFLFVYTKDVNATSGLVLLVSTVFGGLMTLALDVRTEEGERVFRKWKAYRAALAAGQVSKTADLKERHIVYAIALGVGGKRMKTLIERIDPQPADFPWMLFRPGHFPHVAWFSTVVHTTVPSVSTSFSTGSGATGGMAGGGGGGRAG
ncbi:MAG: DUF2207 domain-containing protein [Opitutales bacterium]|nr:DUF2207 domain-containing protein [Opitutales bacterium]